MTQNLQLVRTETELTVFDHIRSLRRTVFSIVGVILLTSGLVHYFNVPILTFLMKPLGTENPGLQFLAPLDPLYFIFKVDFTLGFLLSLPVTIFLIWRFISPAVQTEKFYVPFLIIGSSCLLSLVAGLYAYKLLIPIILNYMSGLVLPGTELSFTANGYLDFLLSTTALLILVFQIPLVIIGLAYIRVLNPDTVSSNRRYIYLGVIVVTAIITPTTDIISLSMIALPAVLVVELGTLMARLVYVSAEPITIRNTSSNLRPALIGVSIMVVCLCFYGFLLFSKSSFTLFSSTTPNVENIEKN